MTDRERDALVAEKVMGFTVHWAEAIYTKSLWLGDGQSVPCYSTEIAAAWQVVEHFVADPQVSVVVNNCHRDEGIEWCVLIADEEQVYEGQGPLPLAICRAALAAVGVEVEE